MQLPNPPWYRRWSVILAGVVGLAAIVAVIGVLGFQNVPSPGPAAATTQPPGGVASTTTLPPTSLTQPQTTTTRGSGALWDRQGKDLDQARSPGFRAPAAWHIEWSFDCSNFRKFGGGNFKITGNGAFERIQIQEFDVKASGSRTVNRSGYGYLLVDSVCKRWHVKAVPD